MADRKISQLTELTSLTDSDFFEVNDVSGTTADNKNKKIKVSSIGGAGAFYDANKIQSINVSATSPTAADYLGYNATTSKYEGKNPLPIYDHKQPTNVTATLGDVDITFSQTVNNVSCMKVTGVSDTQEGGVDFFFVADGRTPASAKVNYKVENTGCNLDLYVFDSAGVTVGTALSATSTSMVQKTVSVSGGTWTAGNEYKVRTVANVDTDDDVHIGSCLITY